MEKTIITWRRRFLRLLDLHWITLLGWTLNEKVKSHLQREFYETMNYTF
jgi:hypothetical protein